MISNIGPYKTLSYTMLTSASIGDKMHIPVRSDQFLFSQFKHVSGVRAKDGQGVTVDKLQILNSLIDQLISMKQKNVLPPVTQQGELSDDQINSLIKQYQDQVRTITAQAENLSYKPPMPELGNIVNLVA